MNYTYTPYILWKFGELKQVKVFLQNTDQYLLVCVYHIKAYQVSLSLLPKVWVSEVLICVGTAIPKIMLAFSSRIKAQSCIRSLGLENLFS